MHFLYIIYSASADRYYTGETTDVPNRILRHNCHKYSRAFTKIASDWQLEIEYRCDTKEDALYLERFIKTMKSKKFIQKIISKPQILKDILEKK